MPTLDERIREFALSLPGAVEEYPCGERVAKAGRKVFAFLGPEGSQLMTVKLRESHGHAMAIDGAAPTGYGLGRSGWINVPVRADGVTFELLCDWVQEIYRIVAPRRLAAELDARD